MKRHFGFFALAALLACAALMFGLSACSSGGDDGSAFLALAAASGGTSQTGTSSDSGTQSGGGTSVPTTTTTTTTPTTTETPGGQTETPVTKYTVTISTEIKNGSVTVDKSSAAQDETVTLTANPASGYALGTLIVTDADGAAVSVSGGKFKMPAKNVTVTATFAEIFMMFGSWPQTIMAASVTVDETETKVVGVFTYCKGSDGAWYVKIKENGFNQGSSVPYKYSDGTSVSRSSVNSYKCFKVEPIKWRILTTDYNGTGKKLLLAENILVNCEYYDYNNVNRTVDGNTVYPNNYEHSKVRAFLNGRCYQKKASSNAVQSACDDYLEKGFLQTAFTTEELSKIADTRVDNSPRSANPDRDATAFNGGENQYAIDTVTIDKVFLLSEREVTKSAYGFDVHRAFGAGNKRIRQTTDYTKASGARQILHDGEGCWWWLRSPYCTDDFDVYGVDESGRAFCGTGCQQVFVGVVPALCVEN